MSELPWEPVSPPTSLFFPSSLEPPPWKGTNFGPSSMGFATLAVRYVGRSKRHGNEIERGSRCGREEAIDESHNSGRGWVARSQWWAGRDGLNMGTNVDLLASVQAGVDVEDWCPLGLDYYTPTSACSPSSLTPCSRCYSINYDCYAQE